MARCEQGATVDWRNNGDLLMLSLSRSSNGLLGGHGKYTKLRIDDADAVIGAALRVCLNNRNPGFYKPHMYKEKEAFETMVAAHRADRGIESDRVYFKGTRCVNCDEYSDRIELHPGDNSKPGKGVALIKGIQPVIVPINASDIELAKALREAFEMCIY